jgi:hypothetical protein
VFFDPHFRTLYPRLTDAPPPEKDGQYIAVEVDRDTWFQDYVSKDGKWIRHGLPFRPQDA